MLNNSFGLFLPPQANSNSRTCGGSTPGDECAPHTAVPKGSDTNVLL